MNSIDLGRVISTTIDIYKRDWLMHIVATLVFSIVSGFSFGLLNGTLMAGYFRALKATEQGNAFQLGDMFSSFNDQLGLSLITGLIATVLVAVGFIFCFVPGLLLLPMIPLAIGAITLGTETDGVEAIKRAWEQLKENWLMALITMIVLSFLSSLGAILCGVGILLTAPLYLVGMYAMTSQLYTQADDTTAPAGTE